MEYDRRITIMSQKFNSVVEKLAYNAKVLNSKTAIIVGDEKTSYSDLWSLVFGFAVLLRKKGVNKGDTVVCRASQTLSFSVSYWATHLAGAAFVPVENSIPNEGILNIVNEVNTKIVISKDEDVFNSNIVKINISDVIKLSKENRDCEYDFEFPNINDISEIMFTTGTTGKSKGVVLQHKAILCSAGNLIFGNEYNENTIIAVPGPLNHSNAIRKLYTSIYNGNTVVILDGMTKIVDFYNALDKYKVNALCLPPSAVQMLFVISKEKIGNYADQIDFVESAGAPLPVVDRERLMRLLPKSRLYIGYGSTEAGPMCEYNYNKFEKPGNCVGEVMPNGNVVIVNDKHEIINSSCDNLGLLACGGDIRMLGYWNEPELTKQTMNSDYVYTNDIGYIDIDNFVYIVGRQDDVINSGGLKIAPIDVENVALEIDGVNECICIAMKDKLLGFVPKLLIVFDNEKEYDSKAIINHLSNKLESFKVPKIVERVDSIEKTYNGKLNRKFYRLI